MLGLCGKKGTKENQLSDGSIRLLEKTKNI